ncbi:hypothetical protein ACETIH_02465 [Microvirga arabica]|uniref:Uncharacterized protein n=1 Tax=Microvirga arabica TaxID=1128671 RepID=A0ABV6Y2V9_9HYPH
MPPSRARTTGLTRSKLSRRTREPRQARLFAVQMNDAAEGLFTSLDPRAITREQVTELFREAFESHSSKLALLANFGRQHPTIDPVLESAEERPLADQTTTVAVRIAIEWPSANLHVA